MENVKNLLISLHNDEDGATATEYIILLVLIACFVIMIVKAFGGTVAKKFQEANTDVKTNVDFSSRPTG
ncbi:Flp family type IVb pilin [Bradymonadaceae bacterium TMQ3]|uniref:Flp family type IVb pilin n=1 Tax=Lujinxingia sediminis TaxID=2480984 RepID=A0ABY0CSH0_9DELT|nr:Flp family type IVb pilin [Lujinxingia sediminis]RDV38186.1 Flp family type IVb pilin [Bradymonadaceae bacterium TMQ3]RVU43615.1 Flp family type IVb pilin [Lujinxingia sediminis]TXC75856.1 Flp family type IVb pilin [Bradymonadales bacterium TMQ1]